MRLVEPLRSAPPLPPEPDPPPEPAGVRQRVVEALRSWGWMVIAALYLWLSVAAGNADRRENAERDRRIEALERLHEAPGD